MHTMKKFTLAALLALPLLAAAQQQASASGGCCNCLNFGCDVTIKKWANPGCGCGPCGDNCGCSNGGGCGPFCGPWYQYFPMEAHFQTPAPTGYPFWPSPMTQYSYPGNMGGPAPVAPASFQPVGYYPQYPNYWYGR
jgi:hypothetical protein